MGREVLVSDGRACATELSCCLVWDLWEMQYAAGVWYLYLCCWSGVAELSGVWGDCDGPRVSGGASAAAQVGRSVWGLGACV